MNRLRLWLRRWLGIQKLYESIQSAFEGVDQNFTATNSAIEKQIQGEAERHKFCVERLTQLEERIGALENALVEVETNTSKQLAEMQETANAPRRRSTHRNFTVMREIAARGAQAMKERTGQ